MVDLRPVLVVFKHTFLHSVLMAVSSSLSTQRTFKYIRLGIDIRISHDHVPPLTGRQTALLVLSKLYIWACLALLQSQMLCWSILTPSQVPSDGSDLSSSSKNIDVWL